MSLSYCLCASAAQTCGKGTELPPAQTYLSVSSDPLQPCAGNAHVSFARSFGRSVLPTLPADDVVFLVPCGMSGSGFLDTRWTAYTGNGFVQAVARLDATWRLLHADERWQQYNITFSAILWHQGEQDAGDNWDGPYAANTSYYLTHDIIPMIAAFRNTTLIPYTHHTLPFVVGQLLPSWVSNSSWPARAGVEAALATLPQYVANSGYANSSGLQGDLTYRSGVSNEIIHFTAASQRMFGERYHVAYQQALLNYPHYPLTSSSSSSGSVAISSTSTSFSSTSPPPTANSAVSLFAAVAVVTAAVLAVSCVAALAW